MHSSKRIYGAYCALILNGEKARQKRIRCNINRLEVLCLKGKINGIHEVVGSIPISSTMKSITYPGGTVAVSKIVTKCDM